MMTGNKSRRSGRGKGNGRGQTRDGNPIANQATMSRQSAGSSKPNRSPSFDHEEMNSTIPERFRSGRSRKNDISSDRLSGKQFNEIDVSLNIDIRKYVQAQNALSALSEKDAWIERTEIPLSSEVNLAQGTVVELKPNKPHKKFKTVADYLKTHYSLQREDGVGPLREAVDTFRDNPMMDDDNNVSVYEKVHICGFTFANLGIAARLKFSTKRARRRILWSASKRLVSGSLVALTPSNDNFRTTCIIAVIAARPLEFLERSPPELDIYFGSVDDIQIDPQTEYVMVESKQGYFEAHRHTLKALQKLSSESFPLSPHITGADTNVIPPDYLAESSDRSLVAALEANDKDIDDFLSVDIVNDWPEVPAGTTLDKSQWSALNRILTQKLAIIQGPPGTGKTHVSKVALEIMVRNRVDGDPPIIIAAQTNHALDQLLKHVSKFDPEYIRLGGRSTNAEIKKRALFEVRQRERIPPIPGSLFGPTRKKLEREHARYGEILAIFDEKTNLISSEQLLKLGVITAAQEKSLVKATEDWITSDDTKKSPLEYWLHKTLLSFEVIYGDDDFGFGEVEEDLEIEQLLETEAEHGVADEEDIEMLRGPWKAVSDEWTVASPSESDIEQAKRLLETKQNLWDVPEYMRGPVFWVMKNRAKDIALKRFREAAHEYARLVEDLKIGKWEKDAVFLKRANIIGMTTTGLSKYRALISGLRPRIILIEEAAEVIEGPVTAACMESLQHLILVGDHKQLQGHCALQELENEPYYLNISMFERLVNLNMPFKTLACQRRMIKEIRELINYLYPELEDHESILSRPRCPPWGTGSLRSFFFKHNWSETKDDSLSTLNEEEARMVARFYRHLLRNGVPPSAITILTFYNGQRKRILKELRIDPETSTSYNNVKTVDSYQGEENDIIILSLVRNNDYGSIGFLDKDNRVCVALSRAKNGFYIFGNLQLVADKNKLWEHVMFEMESTHPTRVGTQIPLTCITHNRTVMAEWPEDFDKLDGGCDYWCETKLNCGHTCPRKCHPKPHEYLLCNEKCGKPLSCGHSCNRSCHAMCTCDCEKFRFSDSYETEYDLDTKESANPLSTGLQHADRRLITGLTSDRSNMSKDQASDVSSRLSTSRQPVKPLARGGAAFQPLSLSHHGEAHYEIPAQNGIRRGMTAQTNAAQRKAWSEIAVEGINNGLYQPRTGNLLDLAVLDNRHGTIAESKEEVINAQRSKFTQMYHPAAPNEQSSVSVAEVTKKDVAKSGFQI